MVYGNLVYTHRYLFFWGRLFDLIKSYHNHNYCIIIIITNSLPQFFIAGMFAGAFTSLVTAPTERIKCVMQVHPISPLCIF